MANRLRNIVWKNRFARWVFLPILGLYLVLFCVGLFVSDSLIFRPHNASYHDDQTILKLTTADGIKISARYLPNPPATYTILYSHGNGEDLGDDRGLLQGLHDLGFSVLSYDYHGYGTSDGSPSEAIAYKDIDAAYAYLTTTLKIPTNRIIVFGRSLGGGPSVDLASRRPVGGLVVESSFMTAFRARTQVALLPFDKFRSIEKIGRVRCPVLVMHGTSDYVIPFHHGVELYTAVRSPKCHLWVEGAGHNNLRRIAGNRYPKAIRAFMALVERQHPQTAPSTRRFPVHGHSAPQRRVTSPPGDEHQTSDHQT